MEKYWAFTMRFFSKYWGCHQMPSRSFFVGSYQFPLCARCTGILIGFILSTAIIVCDITIMGETLTVSHSLLFMIPMVVDGTVQLCTTYESTNLRRVVTGAVFSMGLFFFLYNLQAWIL